MTDKDTLMKEFVDSEAAKNEDAVADQIGRAHV